MATIHRITQEDQIRTEPFCRGCGKPKPVEDRLMVCWGCFKYRDNPLKYFSSAVVSEWLKSLPHEFCGQTGAKIR